MSEKQKRTKKRSYNSFNNYTYLVLKQVHPDTSIAKSVNDRLSMYIRFAASKIARTAILINKTSKTVTSREIQAAIRAIFPRELAKHAVSDGTKAITSFINEDSGSHAVRAGIKFPPSRFDKIIRESGGSRVGKTAGVYLAAVMEYLIVEILDLAGNAARDRKKVTITMKDVATVLQNDYELYELTKKFKIRFEGINTVEHIDKAVYPKMKQGPRGGKGKMQRGTHISQIKGQQKQIDCLRLAKAPFQRLVREIAQDFKNNLNFSQEALVMIQYHMEQKMIDRLRKANIIVLNSGRTRLSTKDILSAEALEKY